MDGFEPCNVCGYGMYSNTSMATSCVGCGGGKSTLVANATGIQFCLSKWGGLVGTDVRDVCGVGSYSLSGSPPCSLCPMNTYGPTPNATGCLLCPSGFGTGMSGAMSVSACLGEWGCGFFVLFFLFDDCCGVTADGGSVDDSVWDGIEQL
jgi:hypothetical protein